MGIRALQCIMDKHRMYLQYAFYMRYNVRAQLLQLCGTAGYATPLVEPYSMLYMLTYEPVL